MSYGQRMIFDKKSHQRRSAIIARLSYAFSAAQLLDDYESTDLSERVIDHLEGAQQTLYYSLGESELRKSASPGLNDLAEPVQDSLRRSLGAERFEELANSGSISSMDDDVFEEIVELIGQSLLTKSYRQLILSVGDQLWVDYLTQMEALRTSIGLEAYGQRDPLVQYKSRAYDMFQQLLAEIRAGVVHRLFRTQQVAQAQTVAAPTARAASAQAAAQQASTMGSKRKRRRRRR
jgi:preprotein translocase subunit SecA